MTRIDGALVLADETGEHWTDAFLHRLRGEILLERDPANTAPAEEAFHTGIAIAQAQKVPSFELSAALDLARLYNSTGRSADAHALLTPELAGFRRPWNIPKSQKRNGCSEHFLSGSNVRSGDVDALVCTAADGREAE